MGGGITQRTVKMKAYEMIIDGGEQVFKCVRPAKDIKQLKYIYGGNGEFVRIKDVTNDYPIDVDYLRDVLTGKHNGHFGEVETDIICSVIQRTYDNA